MTFTLTNVRLLWRPTLQRLATFSPTCGYGFKTGLPGGGAEVGQVPCPTGAGGDGLWEECTGLARPGVTGVFTLVVTTTQCLVTLDATAVGLSEGLAAATCYLP